MTGIPGLALACSKSSLEPSGSVIVSSSPWKQMNGNSTDPRSAHKASVAARYSVAFLALVQPCQTRGSAQHGSLAHSPKLKLRWVQYFRDDHLVHKV